MFSFIKRLKQMAGVEPLDRMHLGQYAYKESFQPDFTFEDGAIFEKPQRINTDIYLNAYETKSFKIVIEDKFGSQEWHLLKMPYEDSGYEIYPVMNDNKGKFIVALKPNYAYIKAININLGTRFYN